MIHRSVADTSQKRNFVVPLPFPPESGHSPPVAQFVLPQFSLPNLPGRHARNWNVETGDLQAQ